jgi:LysR family transcriptional regulator, nitrogen assimilation regulatory protein
MYQSLLAQSGFSMERLASFCAVADSGSIARASRGDPSTASLMSRQIRELETFFGVDLVRRKGRGLELTEAGLELAAVGRENFKGIADFAARCQRKEWCARIVASNSVAQWVLLPRLGGVFARAPGVRFEIHHKQTREMVAGTREGAFDLAFVRKDALLPGLKHAPLGEVRHSIFVPVSLSKHPPKSAAAAVVSLPFALPIGGKMRESIEALAAKSGKAPKLTVACSSYLQAAGLVRAGTCAAALPDTALASMQGIKVHRLAIPDRFTLCLAWTARNAGTRPALSGLIETLTETMSI